MKIGKIKAPNTYLIIFSLLVIVAVLTWIIPGGEYPRIEVNGRMEVVGTGFTFIKSNPQGFFDIFMAPLKGFEDAAFIIGFVLFIGGVFGVLKKTEAVDSALRGVAKAHSKSKFVRMTIIPLFMILFSLAGSIFGMSEEVIPFILLFVPMALMLGYDTVTGVAIPFIGAGVGFAGAYLNPFTIGVAQAISGLPLFSGIAYRMIVWLVTTTVAIIFVMRYASKIKSHPEKSITYEKDKLKKKKIDFEEIENHDGMSVRHKLVLISFVAGIGVLIFGVLEYGWYITEISALFIVIGLVVGILGKLSPNEFTASFLKGAGELVSTALIIALARGILVIAKDGHIIDTILYALSGPISSLHPIVSAQAMFLVQTAINFFVPSGSGQAALTMPIMAPLADIVGVSRQTAVLAFQFGDGFSNMIIPTSAVTMGVLTLADIPWEKWARWVLPLEIIFLLVGFLLLIPPFLIGWQ